MNPFADMRSSIRWRTILTASLAAMVEGYDLQVVGYAAPVISDEWQLAPGAFGPTFSVGLVGLMLGCLFVAPIADRFGRKFIVVGATIAYGLLVLLSATAETLDVLFWMRFFTGLGIGGALPNVAAIAAEAAPVRWRTTTVAILFSGFGFGSFVGGLVAAALVDSYGWQSVFVFGGVAALGILPILIMYLPPGRGGATSAAQGSEPTGTIPVFALFHDGRARATALLWVIFFMGLMDLYLLASWLPTTIAAQGNSVQVAALITGLMQIGGIAGAFLMSPIVDRMGPNPILPLAYLMAAICIALIGFAGSSVIITICAVFGAGFGIIGCQCSDNGVVAKLYPMRMRATGVGWALGIGRLGSIVGPFLVGRAIATEMETQTIFVLSAIPAVVAALAYFALGNMKMAAAD